MIRLTWLCDDPEDHEVVVFTEAVVVVFEDRVGRTHVLTPLGRLPVRESVDEVLQRARAEEELKLSALGRTMSDQLNEAMDRIDALEKAQRLST